PSPLDSTLNLLLVSPEFAGATLYPDEIRGEGPEIDRESGGLREQLVRVQPLSVGPEAAEPLTRLIRREPVASMGALELPAPLHLERPGPQVAGDVEPRIDVGEPGLGGPR